jgi:hypothetical protein
VKTARRERWGALGDDIDVEPPEPNRDQHPQIGGADDDPVEALVPGHTAHHRHDHFAEHDDRELVKALDRRGTDLQAALELNPRVVLSSFALNMASFA